LGRNDLSIPEIRKLVGRPLRGELTPPVKTKQFSPTQPGDRLQFLFSQLLSLTKARSTESTASSEHWRSSQFSPEEKAMAEQAMIPVLLSQAAAVEDDSLKTLLSTLHGLEPIEQSSDYNVGNHLNQPHTIGSLLPLHVAASRGITPNVELLLKHGASVHRRDQDGHTAIYCAAVSFVLLPKRKLC